MNELEKKISAYALNEEKAFFLVGMMMAGLSENHDAIKIIQRITAHVLFDFHGIPVTPQSQN